MIVVGVSFHIPTSGHCRTGTLIADWMTSDGVDLLNHLQHAMEESVLFDNYQLLVSPIRSSKRRGHSLWWASHSPNSAFLGQAQRVKKFPLTFNGAYFSWKKYLGVSSLEDVTSVERVDETDGECGRPEEPEIPWGGYPTC